MKIILILLLAVLSVTISAQDYSYKKVNYNNKQPLEKTLFTSFTMKTVGFIMMTVASRKQAHKPNKHNKELYNIGLTVCVITIPIDIKFLITGK